MHDELFEKSDIVARYRAGPYVEAREGFLRQAGAGGYSRTTLKRIAWVLLIVAEAAHSHGGSISIDAAITISISSAIPAIRHGNCLRSLDSAQAIATRTYALHQRALQQEVVHQRARQQPATHWDVRATEQSQVYRGIESETQRTRRAADATRGEVLTLAGQPILAVFH